MLIKIGFCNGGEMMMRATLLVVPILAALFAPPSGYAQAKPEEPTAQKPADPYAGRAEASIPFADSIGIRNFDGRREAGKDVLYIEGANGRWYRARMFGFCPDLRFTFAVSFVPSGANTLDRFSKVLVPPFGRPGIARQCPIESLVELTKEEAVALKLRRKPREPQQISADKTKLAKPDNREPKLME
jgi:hypothetical protein